MPQPLSKRCPKATVLLSTLSLSGKPHLPELVCSIIAASSDVDHELSLLMARILGADAAAAIAVFDVLRGFMREKALETAAKVALNPGQYRVLLAVLQMAKSAQSDRHKIAHGVWGSCPELPDALLVADPTFLRWQEIEKAKAQSKTVQAAAFTLADFLRGKEPPSLVDTTNLYEIDKNRILVYEARELVEILGRLMEVRRGLFLFKYYLSPFPRTVISLKADKDLGQFMRGLDTSAGALRKLGRLSLFRAAVRDLDAKRETEKKTKKLPLP